MFYTAPDKTASRRFEPNGIYFGEVKRVDANLMVWVEIPRLVQGFEFGPVNVAGGPTPRVGDRVGCVFVENRADDIVVVGVLQDTDTGLFLPTTQCTSTTRPPEPREGELIWETDADQLRVWTGATWLAVATGTSLNPDNATVEIASGVLRVKDAGITAAKLDPLVAGAGLAHSPTTGLAVNAGAGLQINNDSIRISSAAAGDGLLGGSGQALRVNVDASTIEIVADVVQLKDAGVTPAKVNASVAGAGLVHDSVTGLAVNPDNVTVEVDTDAVRVKDGGITRPKLIQGEGDNLIVDPLFERSTLATTPHALVTGGGTWDFSTAEKRSGTHSLQHNPTGQTVPATLVFNGPATSRPHHAIASEGDRFVFEVWARREVATHNDVTISLEFRDAAGVVVSTATGTRLVPSIDFAADSTASTTIGWNRLRVIGQAPATATWVVPVVTIASNSRTGSLFFDSASLRRTVDAAVLDVNVERAGFRNALMNGDFSVNQRGFSSTTADGYGFDRWQTIRSSCTLTYSSQAFTPGSPAVVGYEARNFARCVVSGASGAGNFAIFRQPVEDVRTLAGAEVTISFWAKCASGTPQVVLELERNFGTGGSPSPTAFSYLGRFQLTTTWQRHSLTVRLPDLSGLTIGTNLFTSWAVFNFWLSAGSNYLLRTGAFALQDNTFDFWGMQIERGSVATPFEVRPYQVELAACQRYYERVPFVVNAAGQLFQNVFYAVHKRVTPTSLTIVAGTITPATLNSRSTNYFTVDGLATSNAAVTAEAIAEF